MNDIDKQIQDFAKWATLLTAVILVWKNIKVLWNEILNPLWNRLMKPSIKVLLFLCSLTIPNGVILWFFFNLAMKNSNRLDEQAVFWLLVVQSAFVISVYTFFWGRWLYPWLLPLIQRRNSQLTNTQTSQRETRVLNSEKSEDEYQ